ncbi:hypothetical protein I302_109106 [Kwoniella bestiolae CBS 10118]|uniref:C2H2-type domain-containing protein n=1 Tax=Kwoniella bestiolae CBS 10118 TaxID=1296100 RepID=A0A1B9FV02_9TREE|nr:hypothetical protein I302_08251 [Kwoniella bestiolae CBS 10118]OCF22600.1 hypothetical protein I302_08251 [Kwoniella bestiolae CBS 10118]
MTESSYDSFYFPPSSSSFPFDPTAFYQDHHPGYPQPDVLGPPPSSQTDTINLNLDYQDSYPYQYPYNPSISSSFDTQQIPPPTISSYTLPSSSPISSVPGTEIYQPYPPYLPETSSSIPPSSPTEGSLPEVANFPSQQSFESTISSTTEYPLMVIREGQTMERGYTWPIAGGSSLEGKMQDMHLHDGGNGMWHVPCEMERGQSEVANQPQPHLQISYDSGKSCEMLNSITNFYPESSSSSLAPSFRPPAPQYGENPNPHLWDTSSTSRVYTTPPTQPTTPRQTFTSAPTWQSYSYHSPTTHEYQPPPILLLGHQHRYTSSSPTLQGYKPVTSTPLTTSFSLPTPIPSTPTFVVRPSLDMLTSRVVRPKRRLPTPPRITGWIPPEQRPLPFSDVVGEQGRPRLIPSGIPRLSTIPTMQEKNLASIPQPNTALSTVRSAVPFGPDEKEVSKFQFDTCLPQTQHSNPVLDLNRQPTQQHDTFAFAMSYPSGPDHSVPTSSRVSTSMGHQSTNVSNDSMIFSSTSSRSLKKDLLTRVPYLLSPSDPLGPSDPWRPGSEPIHKSRRRRPRLKSGNRRPSTSVMGMGIARRLRIEQKLANYTGRKFICGECDEPFTRRNDLERHARSKHTGETPFICPGCEKGFSRKDKLDQHIEKVPECKAIAPPREERVRRRNVNRVEPEPNYQYYYE